METVLITSSPLENLLFNHAPAGIAMFDREMRYVEVSTRWCLDYGVDSTHILGQSHYDVFPDIPQHWVQLHRRALNGESLHARDDRWDRTSGTTWVNWEIRPWTKDDGSIGGILILAENITEFKNLEDAVRAHGGKEASLSHSVSEPRSCPFCGDSRLWRDLTVPPPLATIVPSTLARIRCANQHVFFIQVEVLSSLKADPTF